MAALGFDELNVIREADALYNALNVNNHKFLKELFIERYVEMCRYLKHEVPKEDLLDSLAEMHLAGLLGEPNEVTHYTYNTETLRKRDRAAEGINSVAGKTRKQLEADKALRIWSQMTWWYADFVADDASVQAMRDAGYKSVIWHTQDDEKVCKECGRMDEIIYPISKIPPKPHPHCRCWVSPYKKD